MKGFDCSKCRNKGDGERPCNLLSVVPVAGTCAGYTGPPLETRISNLSMVNPHIKRKAMDLAEDYEDLIPEMTPGDWIRMLQSIARMKGIKLEEIQKGSSSNLNSLRRFINSWSPEDQEE